MSSKLSVKIKVGKILGSPLALLALTKQDAVGPGMRTGASAAKDGSLLAKQQHPSYTFLFLNSGSIL